MDGPIHRAGATGPREGPPECAPPPPPAETLTHPDANTKWTHAKGGNYLVFGVAEARGKKVEREVWVPIPKDPDLPPSDPRSLMNMSRLETVTVDVLEANDGDPLVVYFGDDGKIHVRGLADFLAKFTPVPPSPT